MRASTTKTERAQRGGSLPLVLALLVGLPVLALVVARPGGSAGALTLNNLLPPAGPVYAVGAVRAGLAHDPQAWIGRTVRLRAVADDCLSWAAPAYVLYCRSRQPVLRDASTTGGSDALPALLAPDAGPLASLRQLPLLARWLPATQHLWWHVPRTYVVRLSRLPADACWPATPCVAAFLLHADRTAL